VNAAFGSIGAEIEAVHLRAALQEAMRIASLVNQYLDQTAPWSTLKHNPSEAALSVYTALSAIDSLKILLAPFLPFTCQRLHEFFGYEEPLFGDVCAGGPRRCVSGFSLPTGRATSGGSGGQPSCRALDLKRSSSGQSPAAAFPTLQKVG
jgi:hypothetical protein